MNIHVSETLFISVSLLGDQDYKTIWPRGVSGRTTWTLIRRVGFRVNFGTRICTLYIPSVDLAAELPFPGLNLVGLILSIRVEARDWTRLVSRRYTQMGSKWEENRYRVSTKQIVP